MRIISRSEWGARAARGSQRVARSQRKTFVVHYDGSAPVTRTGPSVPQAIQRYHMDSNGWRDGGYNFVVDQAGNIFEMRGWDEVGAHAGTRGNVEGIGVQVAIGGLQEPSEAALRALVWLKDEADRRMGPLSWRNHGDYMSTSCAGGPLRKWLAAGRPLKPVGPAPAPKPAPAPAPQKQPTKEETVPAHKETSSTLHCTGTDWRLMNSVLIDSKPVAQRAAVTAQFRFPTDRTVQARFVSWDNKNQRWVRYPSVTMTGGTGTLTMMLGQGGPHADLKVDVKPDADCRIDALMTALVWDVTP